jgi:hypothetical protein
LSSGRLFGIGRSINVNVVWHVVHRYCHSIGARARGPRITFAEPAPSCAPSNGGELEQIRFLLGHISVQTTERYLGCKQNLSRPVNDRFEIVPQIAGND